MDRQIVGRRLTSGSYRLARRTAAFSLSGITSSGTPPQCSNIRTCDTVQSGSDRVSVTSTNVWFDAASTPTNTFASWTSPVRRSVTSTVGPA